MMLVLKIQHLLETYPTVSLTYETEEEMVMGALSDSLKGPSHTARLRTVLSPFPSFKNLWQGLRNGLWSHSSGYGSHATTF